jgi:ABC-type polysaccharide/polyol phosphate export permease
MLILKKKFFRQAASMSVSPLLYIIAFGYGLGKDMRVHDHSYIEFLIPGLAAMSSMTQSFAIASEINIARFYWRIFEEFQSAPIRNIAYVTGEVLAGVTRALLSVAIIVVISLLFGITLSFNAYFWLSIILNGFVFASLAVCLAMLVKSHSDQALLTNFFITPMAFLGGTFFPVDRMPGPVRDILGMLPLTYATKAVRSAAFGLAVDPFSLFFLFATGSVLFVLAFYAVNRAKE